MKSLLRHVHQLWKLHRGYVVRDDKTGEVLTAPEICAAIMFNTQGYAFACNHGRGTPHRIVPGFAEQKLIDLLAKEVFNDLRRTGNDVPHRACGCASNDFEEGKGQE